MVATVVAPPSIPAEQLAANHPEIAQLIFRAQEADAADHALTIKQALRKYKKAVAWALALSICLVMDGYDVSMLEV